MDAFDRECKLKNVKTLDQLNALWSLYLEEYYHRKAHSGIAEYYQSQGVVVPADGITPVQEWNRDSRPLTFIDTATVAEAFLHHETRKVDRGACIKFQGRKYEAKPSLIGQEVEIAYDPVSPETIRVYHPHVEPFEAAIQAMDKPETSRLLDGLEKRHRESKTVVADAISFADYRREGKDNV